jgi:O-antigen ligase
LATSPSSGPITLDTRETAIHVSAPLARLAGRTSSILLLVSVLGYPVIGVVTSYYSVQGSDVAIGFRAAVVLLAAFGITLGLIRLPVRTLSFLPPVMVLFFLLYSMRLVSDALSGQFPGIGIDALYFYGTCVIPSLAICVLVKYRDPSRDASLFLLVGGFLCSAILLMSVTGITGDLDSADAIQGRLALGRLNPISIGHVGATTIIAGMALYFERGHANRWKLVAVPICALALACMIYSGSRGPVISLVGAVMALLVFRRRWSLLVLVATASVIVALNTIRLEGELLERLLSIGQDGSSLARIEVQSLALEQFLASPLIGSAYVELLTGFYPHNIILEAAMSLGVVGLFLMLVILVTAVLAAIRHTTAGELMLPLLTVQYLLAVQFSGAIVSSAEFWAAFALVLAQWRTRRTVRAPATAEP